MAGKTSHHPLKFSFLCLFLMPLSTWAQGNVTFNNTFDFNHGYETGTSVLTLDEGYVICATGAATEYDGWRGLKLIKTDFNGNELWRKTYGNIGQAYFSGRYGGLIRLNDGFFLAASVADSGSTNGRGVLYRFDENGDTLWTRVYDTPQYELFNNAKQTADKGFIVSGVRYTSVNVPQYWLMKTDSLGMAEWDTVYNGWGYGSTIEITLDGGYIIGGSGGAGLSEARIVKTDSMGNVQWSRNHFGGNQYGCYWSVGLASDGGYYIWGCYDTVINPTDFYLTASVAKLDNAGNRVWTNHYRCLDNKLIAVYQVKELPSGELMIAGEKADQNVPAAGGWIVKSDLSGNTIWEKIHTYTQDSSVTYGANTVYDFTWCDDGGYIFTGVGFNDIDPGPNFNNNQDIWLLKLDSLGNWYAPADTDTCPPPCDTVGIGEITGLQANLYPNPATNTLTIELPAGGEGWLTLYNLLGQEVLGTATHGRQTTVGLSLPQGVYIYRITKGTQHANGKLLVE